MLRRNICKKNQKEKVNILLDIIDEEEEEEEKVVFCFLVRTQKETVISSSLLDRDGTLTQSLPVPSNRRLPPTPPYPGPNFNFTSG